MMQITSQLIEPAKQLSSTKVNNATSSSSATTGKQAYIFSI